MIPDQEPEIQDPLLEKSEISEQPFSSQFPLLGPVIVWLRTRWNNVAARWYVRPLTAQQNEFNRLVAHRLRQLETYVYELTAAQDRDITRMKRDVAALQLQLDQLNERLNEMHDQFQRRDDQESRTEREEQE